MPDAQDISYICHYFKDPKHHVGYLTREGTETCKQARSLEVDFHAVDFSRYNKPTMHNLNKSSCSFIQSGEIPSLFIMPETSR